MAPRQTARLIAALACLAALVAVAAADPLFQDLGLGTALIQANQQLQVSLGPLDLNAQCDKIKTLNAKSNKEACEFVGLVEIIILGSYNNKCNDPSTGTGAQMQPPSNGGVAPAPLTKPKKVPAEFTGAELDALLKAEGQTLAFLWVAVRNMYGFNTCSPENGGSYSGYLLPDGFTGVGGKNGVYYNKQIDTPDTVARPYVTIMKKNTTLIIVYRGTGSLAEWFTNFAYDRVKNTPFYTPENEATEKFPGAKFKGETHRGFTRVFQQLWPSIRAAIDTEVVNGNAIHLYVTGHSQGGPIATYTAYAIDRYLKRGAKYKRSKDFSLDLVVFESPLPGNTKFAKSTAKINSRNIKFINDVIAQIPCSSPKNAKQEAMPGCGALPVNTTGTNPDKPITAWPDYAPIAGAIIFTGPQMPVQQQLWAQTNNVSDINTAPQDLVAIHGCSVSCFLSGHSEDFPADHCIIEPPPFGNHTVCTFP
ncbi:hypothetical protein Rsub_04680 [Raphidocelis subcapitata]|uniref:Fungal lipase-type domain-containing protein n=1 Tax=Raphidocelis subcapitata TaxID=307507 RepID=A0A2V0NWF8_9CHLO|nr:hypothetical protein Rsub_04680 [Raphidocelis subcapitata]|eukprot:GBF91956.1 hypothetical protein Rsub_04680 [Raphidocelis subcapitata]